jgi:dihydrofolate reductase
MTTNGHKPLIAALQVTLDGYIWDSEEAVDWVDSWADGLALLPAVDAFVLGGGMFPEYERFWTTILEDPDAAAELLGREPYPREVEYARVAAATPHLVLSRTLTEVIWPTARIVRDLDELRAATDDGERPAYVVGGPGLVATLIDAEMLDELRLIVHPLVVHGGRPLFARRQALELVATAPLADGRVGLTYRPEP